MKRDDDLRVAGFRALDVLGARVGRWLPYRNGLDAGFAYAGRRVPFLTYQKGIHRAAAQRGPAALALVTSRISPYEDEPGSGGFWYAYRAGSLDQPDNRALRAAHELGVPLTYDQASLSGAGEVAGLAQVEWQRRQSIAVSAVPQADPSAGPAASGWATEVGPPGTSARDRPRSGVGLSPWVRVGGW